MAIFDSCMVTGFDDGRLMLADRDTMLSAVTTALSHLALPEQPPSSAGPVERVSICNYDSAEVFLKQHATGSRPVLLTDATDDWPARAKWDWNFFESDTEGCCGGAAVQVTYPGGKKRTSRLSDYVRAVRTRKPEPGAAEGELGYCRGWEFEKYFPAMLNDFVVPYLFGRDWFERLPQRFNPCFHWIFIGRAGHATPTHIDPTL